MRAWINGRLLDDPKEPAVAVTDHGVTVGDAVFEAVKVVRGAPFALERHLERLERSASGLGLEGLDVEVVRRGVAAVLAEEPVTLGRLRITVTGGRAPLGSGRGDGEPTVIVVVAPMDRAPRTTAVADFSAGSGPVHIPGPSGPSNSRVTSPTA
jgi:branched-chain amino acid aminotransferase